MSTGLTAGGLIGLFWLAGSWAGKLFGWWVVELDFGLIHMSNIYILEISRVRPSSRSSVLSGRSSTVGHYTCTSNQILS